MKNSRRNDKEKIFGGSHTFHMMHEELTIGDTSFRIVLIRDFVNREKEVRSRGTT